MEAARRGGEAEIKLDVVFVAYGQVLNSSRSSRSNETPSFLFRMKYKRVSSENNVYVAFFSFRWAEARGGRGATHHGQPLNKSRYKEKSDRSIWRDGLEVHSAHSSSLNALDIPMDFQWTVIPNFLPK